MIKIKEKGMKNKRKGNGKIKIDPDFKLAPPLSPG